ncbi:MAG: peptidoglycan-binding protein [Clostridia bacterium]
MKILIYNPATNKMETWYRSLNQSMPYAPNLSVKEFRGSSKATTLFADKRILTGFQKLRKAYGKKIKVGYGFKSIREGGHSGQSQHYAGTALDMAQGTTNAERIKIRNTAKKLGIFKYIEPAYLTPTWVHLDIRTGKPACNTGGYPLVKQGSKGVYVAVLQDALDALGHGVGKIDGIFGIGTKNAVKRFQKANLIAADGIVGCETWRKIVEKIIPHQLSKNIET